MQKLLIPIAALALAGCETVDGPGRLDDIMAGRCANAELRITQLEATADLYDADDLAERLHRARRLAEIWCVDDLDAPVQLVSPEPAIIGDGPDQPAP